MCIFTSLNIFTEAQMNDITIIRIFEKSLNFRQNNKISLFAIKCCVKFHFSNFKFESITFILVQDQKNGAVYSLVHGDI